MVLAAVGGGRFVVHTLVRQSNADSPEEDKGQTLYILFMYWLFTCKTTHNTDAFTVQLQKYTSMFQN